MKKILKEPLLHFLLIGVGLFFIYDRVAGENQEELESDTDPQIVVGEGRIEQLVQVFAKTWQRPPTQQELQGLIEDFVLEEAYYRQAVAMGLDRDDTVVRRRLRQKMEFLTDDTSSLITPTDEDLAQYLAAHEDTFRQPNTYTFQQVYFSSEKHGNDPEAYVAAQLREIQSSERNADLTNSEIGDVSLLPTSFQEATQRAVDGTFGSGFSRSLDDLKKGQWDGPVRSGLGYHLVRIDSITEGRLPELSDIRPIVQREWSNEKRLALREKANKSLLNKYDVVIRWPKEEAASDEGAAATR